MTMKRHVTGDTKWDEASDEQRADYYSAFIKEVRGWKHDHEPEPNK